MNKSSPCTFQIDLFEEPETDVPATLSVDTRPLKDRLNELVAQTDDFRLLERIPISKPDIRLPYLFYENTGDEIIVIFLDTETTGLSFETDAIIELGLVKATYSPSQNRLISIHRIVSTYEDPGKPIPSFITELTGITNDMVSNQHIDEKMVANMLADAALIIAHNAAFDRPFFEKRFKGFEQKNWACSLVGINWNKHGFKKLKLEDLLHKSGYFYEAHRASIDCLALAWLLHIQQQAFADLLSQARKKTVLVQAFGAPFDAKDSLKIRGYQWHDGVTGANKHWWKEISEETLNEEKNYLDELYTHGSDRAGISFRNAAQRFKSL